MKILITAATTFELQGIQERIPTDKKHEVSFSTTGIGSTISAYNLSKLLASHTFDLVLNIGIAGSYKNHLKLGDVVTVGSETFGDLGITHPDKFSSVFEEGLINKNQEPFCDAKLHCPYIDLFDIANMPVVSGLTVNTTSGEQMQIERIKQKFNADIETMEGAAFFYVCLMEKIKFLEIRAISNFVEPRNKNNWRIKEAIENLSTKVCRFLELN